MTVRSLQKDRIFRRDLVQVLAGRKRRRFPKRLDPTAAGDPFARFGLRDARFHFGEKIFARVGSLEIQFHLALADAEDVAMRIGQTGHDRCALQIDLRFSRVIFSRPHSNRQRRCGRLEPRSLRRAAAARSRCKYFRLRKRGRHPRPRACAMIEKQVLKQRGNCSEKKALSH